jgi:hypothetical protein
VKEDFAGFTKLSTKASSWLPPPSVLCSKQIMHCCPRLAALVMRFDHVENNHSLAPLFSGCSRAVTMPVLTNPPVGQTYKTHLVPHAPSASSPTHATELQFFPTLSSCLLHKITHTCIVLNLQQQQQLRSSAGGSLSSFPPSDLPNKKRSATKTKILSTATPCCDHKAAKRVAIFDSLTGRHGQSSRKTNKTKKHATMQLRPQTK